MRSMTGFGTARHESELGVITVQIASVNNKQCRVSMRSDLRDLGLEERIRSLVQKTLKRGSITVQIGFEATEAANYDKAQLQASWREFAALAAELGAPVPRLEDVARLQPRREGPDISALADAVETTVQEALSHCQAMQATEGDAIAALFTEQLTGLRALTKQFADLAAGRVETHAERLQERLQELLTNRSDIEPADLIRELAIYSDRIDVTEELDRLASHLDQFASLIAADQDSGKRIEFLLQEIGREVNTTGSKANDAALQQAVVEAKHRLDQLREQVANIA